MIQGTGLFYIVLNLYTSFIIATKNIFDKVFDVCHVGVTVYVMSENV